MKYRKSDGTEIEIRAMPTPYLLNAMGKAKKEGKDDVAAALLEESKLRLLPCWEIRERREFCPTEPAGQTKIIRYCTQQTNEEAWKFVKQQAELFPNRFFVAHESDPL